MIRGQFIKAAAAAAAAEAALIEPIGQMALGRCWAGVMGPMPAADEQQWRHLLDPVRQWVATEDKQLSGPLTKSQTHVGQLAWQHRIARSSSSSSSSSSSNSWSSNNDTPTFEVLYCYTNEWDPFPGSTRLRHSN
jgi:hypothetical protein